mmetsp:Transcript_47958/g.102821  ORF Transcript_47958/g.102821 Transcript_47958/m.102821 type:complete len:212 (+) Transcript_47958:300-935(+)
MASKGRNWEPGAFLPGVIHARPEREVLVCVHGFLQRPFLREGLLLRRVRSIKFRLLGILPCAQDRLCSGNEILRLVPLFAVGIFLCELFHARTEDKLPVRCNGFVQLIVGLLEEVLVLQLPPQATGTYLPRNADVAPLAEGGTGEGGHTRRARAGNHCHREQKGAAGQDCCTGEARRPLCGGEPHGRAGGGTVGDSPLAERRKGATSLYTI